MTGLQNFKKLYFGAIVYKMLVNTEPKLSGFYNLTYQRCMFGAFACLLFFEILSLCHIRINKVVIFVAPVLVGAMLTFAPINLNEFIRYVLVFCDFPFSFIETVLYTRAICYISRGLKRHYNASQFKTQNSVVTIITLTSGLIILLRGIHTELINVYHGITIGFLLFAFVYTILCSNGIIMDTAMIVLRTALSLSPILTSSASLLNVFLRVFLVSCAFATTTTRFDGDEMMVIKVFASRFKKKQIRYLTPLLLFTYLVLSPDAFLHPSPRICGWQAMICPMFYIFNLMVEVYSFHNFSSSPR